MTIITYLSVSELQIQINYIDKDTKASFLDFDETEQRLPGVRMGVFAKLTKLHIKMHT